MGKQLVNLQGARKRDYRKTASALVLAVSVALIIANNTGRGTGVETILFCALSYVFLVALHLSFRGITTVKIFDVDGECISRGLRFPIGLIQPELDAAMDHKRLIFKENVL